MDRIYVTIVKNDENAIEIEHLVDMKKSNLPQYIRTLRTIQTNVNGVLTGLVESNGDQNEDLPEDEDSSEGDDEEVEKKAVKRKSPSLRDSKKKTKLV